MAKILSETKIGLNKTRIIQKCNLNYLQLQPYIKILLEKQMLTRKCDRNGREKFAQFYLYEDNLGQ